MAMYIEEKERADVEWKFARSKLWISYFEEGGSVPPPFNIIPTPKSVWYFLQWLHRKLCGHSRAAKKEHMRTIRRKVKQASERDFRYQSIMRNLVRRYVTVEQRKAENEGVTEDDVNEIKQDISAFRCELIEILKNSGMNTSTATGTGTGAGGKKNRQKERRLMKGFNIAPATSSASQLPTVAEFMANLQQGEHNVSTHHLHDLFGSTTSAIFGGNAAGPGSTPKKMPHHGNNNNSSSGGGNGDHHHRGGFGRLPRLHIKRSSSHKRRWGTLIEAAKSGRVSRLIGRSRSEDSVCNSHCRNNHNVQCSNHSHSNSPASDDVTESPSDSNPSLAEAPGETVIHTGIGSGALAALRKRRKKFSSSRNSNVEDSGSNPVPPQVCCVVKGSKKQLQRASSVPTRASEVVTLISRHEQSHSQQHSVELSTGPTETLTPSTTEESVATYSTGIGGGVSGGSSSREPLLASSSANPINHNLSGDGQDKSRNGNVVALPNLPGIQPGVFLWEGQ
ncbi:Transient receptor potential-gamma protein [Blattella germanica]|nr:Transient receptor potential-gamma protein [Blattella germanica]